MENSNVGPLGRGESLTPGGGSSPIDQLPPNPMKWTLDDLRMLFIAVEGPEKGERDFNSYQQMIMITCINQMNEVKPKKPDQR